MFTSVKNFFVGIYNKMKSIVMGVIAGANLAVITVGAWLVNKTTGEVVGERTEEQLEKELERASAMTYWDMTKISVKAMFGLNGNKTLKQNVVSFSKWNSAVISTSAIAGGLFSLVGLSFVTSFALVLTAAYVSVFALTFKGAVFGKKVAADWMSEG